MTMRFAAAAGLLALATPAFPAMFLEVTVAKADPGDTAVVINDWWGVNVLPTTKTWVTIDNGVFTDAYMVVYYTRYYAHWWSNGPDNHIYEVDDSTTWYGGVTGGSVRQVFAQREAIPEGYFHCFPYPGDGVCGQWSTFYGSEVYFAVNVANDRPVTFRFYDASPGLIPEPASWAMMIAGFGMVGGAMRQRVRVRAA
jgi:hypothetical protein